ncbi:hypothetical protein HanRHA438_Chr06g0271521 [Helianthus annuus]|nr:hypothetical protein HanRHA438_Chr06g0271521 [Helianthus annuus]
MRRKLMMMRRGCWKLSSPRMQRHSTLWLILLWRKLKKKIKCLQVLIRLMLWFGFTHVCELKFVDRFVCRSSTSAQIGLFNHRDI